MLPYSRIGYKLPLSHLEGKIDENKFHLRNPRVLLSLEHTFLIHVCEFHFKSLMSNCYTKVFDAFIIFENSIL